MASGYEKAACGVEPDKGWGAPSRGEAWATAALALAVPSVLGLILAVRTLIAW